MTRTAERRGENVPTIRTEKITNEVFGRAYSLRYEDPRNPGKSVQATVAPDKGANLVQLQINGYEIIHTDPKKMMAGLWTGCFNLWPFPNRIVRGEGEKAYKFQGQTHSLDGFPQRIPQDELLIHGLVDNQQWEIEDTALGEDYARMRTSISITKESPLYEFFPWKSKLTMEYIVSKEGLEIKYEAQNDDPALDMPSEFAIHPYFLATGALVKIPAESVMETDDRLIPSGKLIPVEGTKYDLRNYTPVTGLRFDDVWTDLQPGQYPAIQYPDLGFELVMETSPDVTHTVCYTGEVADGHFCLEPQTGATNAINMDAEARDERGKIVDEKLANAAHLTVVRPGESHKGWIKFKIQPLPQAA